MTDLIEGTIEPEVAKAVTGAGAMLLKSAELQLRYGKPNTGFLEIAEPSERGQLVTDGLVTDDQEENSLDGVSVPIPEDEVPRTKEIIFLAIKSGKRVPLQMIQWAIKEMAIKIPLDALDSLLAVMLKEGSIRLMNPVKGLDYDRWEITPNLIEVADSVLPNRSLRRPKCETDGCLMNAQSDNAFCASHAWVNSEVAP